MGALAATASSSAARIFARSASRNDGHRRTSRRRPRTDRAWCRWSASRADPAARPPAAGRRAGCRTAANPRPRSPRPSRAPSAARGDRPFRGRSVACSAARVPSRSNAINFFIPALSDSRARRCRPPDTQSHDPATGCMTDAWPTRRSRGTAAKNAWDRTGHMLLYYTISVIAYRSGKCGGLSGQNSVFGRIDY